MSLLNIGSANTAEKPKGYTFASGSIDDFMSDFRTPVQETYVDERSGLESLDEPAPPEPEPEQEPQTLQCNPAVARATGKLLATVTDSAIPAILCAIAKEENVDRFKASESEREALTDAWTEYTKLKGGDIPPGIALMLTVGSIYGAKVPAAFIQGKRRKAETKNDDDKK
jgi:hypothetical protein